MRRELSHREWDQLLDGANIVGNDRAFCMRVWETDPEIYRERLRAVGFSGLGKVLDAGCGFGQWTLALAELNESVTAIDISEPRIEVTRQLVARLGGRNVTAAPSSIQVTGFPDATFDGIFCYSAIFFTDYRRTLSEFARLLKEGGTLYVCANGLGWYLHNLLTAPNPADDFDPVTMAIDTLDNTLSYLTTGEPQEGKQLAIPTSALRRTLEASGFEVLAFAGEGQCAVEGQRSGRSFYSGEYYGKEGVYEVIARRSDRTEGSLRGR
jgi:SAM-dependent methyltransferase